MNFLISSHFKVAIDIVKDGAFPLIVCAINIETGALSKICEIESLADFRLGDVVREIERFAAATQFENSEEDIYPVLIRHIEQYKSNIYGFHLNKSIFSGGGGLIFLFEWYVRQFSIEMISSFSLLTARQRTSLEASIVKDIAEIGNDYSEALELKVFYGAWKKTASPLK